MKTDKSKKVGSCKQSKGPAANPSSTAQSPKGKPIVHTRGQAGYHKR